MKAAFIYAFACLSCACLLIFLIIGTLYCFDSGKIVQGWLFGVGTFLWAGIVMALGVAYVDGRFEKKKL